MDRLDRCDRCGAAGRARFVFVASGDDLIFCGHHAHEFGNEILKVAELDAAFELEVPSLVNA